MKKIDGFATNCGDNDRVITLSNSIYTIGCFRGTKEEAVKAIEEKYTGEDKIAYVKKLNDCEDMEWLTDEIHEQLKDDKDWQVRLAIARYSDKYHEQFKDDDSWRVRLVVAEYSNKYHEQLKDDESWYVCITVAEYKKQK